ncbi:hypothetical protein MSG28_008349 [Choristoneura fumiferana]|uniref:Uncharacterized protein n=1 Tax=Choristoneura fumiferana TaxID=7141 RepID=A0ACC0JB95_CHOFU|nr:hypothetical protein MSG28_008349 [Choristoneura fumiferana]
MSRATSRPYRRTTHANPHASSPYTSALKSQQTDDALSQPALCGRPRQDFCGLPAGGVPAAAGARVPQAGPDFNLLVRRFIKDSYTLDYVEFIRAVEAVKKEGIRGLGVEYQNPAAVIDTTLPKLSRPEVEAGLSTAPLGASEVFHPALKQPPPPRQLIELMLRDYDPLNSGRIAPQQFRRAMDAMGLGVVLSPEEVVCVMRHYLDPNDSQRVCWRTFEDDCDQAGPVGGGVSAPARLGGRARRPGEGELDLAQAALLRVRAATKERSIDLRPAFGDHDEHNNGHVSRGQLRARAGAAGAAAHGGADGPRGSAPVGLPAAVRQESRAGDPRADFYRGLASAGLSLSPLEMDTLMEVFAAPGRRRYVEYQRFSDTVGESLTQGSLERAPLLEPLPHVPTIDSPLNYLNFEERNIVSMALTKLSKFPDQLSNILEVFKDMDRENCGTIPRVSCERALCQRGLLALINYRALCNALDVLHATASAQPC